MIVLKIKNDDGLFVPCRLVMVKLTSSMHRERIESFLVYLSFSCVSFPLLCYYCHCCSRISLLSLSLSRLHMSIRLMHFRIIFFPIFSFRYLLNCLLSCVLFRYCQYMARRSTHRCILKERKQTLIYQSLKIVR